jgi:hypothetical protein
MTPPGPLPPGTLPPIPVPPPGTLPPGTLPPIPVPPPGTLPPIPVPPTEPENPVGSRQPPRVALLVVGNVDNLDAGDESLFTALEGNGFFVLKVDDSATPDPAETALVVIAPTVTSNMIRNKYATLPAPALVMDFGIFDDMGMTGAGENMAFGTTAGRQVAMAADQASHPLAAGRTGTVSISAANAPLNWGVPAPGAIVVATVPGAPQRAAIFGYPKGVAMQGAQMAPAKRVGFFASDMLTSRLSADGDELLKAAIEWAFAP